MCDADCAGRLQQSVLGSIRIECTDADCAGRLQQSVLGSIRIECDADCACRLQHYLYWGVLGLRFAGPRSAVVNVSGYRCVSDCRSRGREFDPGPVPYFRGD